MKPVGAFDGYLHNKHWLVAGWAIQIGGAQVRDLKKTGGHFQRKNAK